MHIAATVAISLFCATATLEAVAQDSPASATAPKVTVDRTIKPDPKLPKQFQGELLADDDGRVLNHLFYGTNADDRNVVLVKLPNQYVAMGNWDGGNAPRSCKLQRDAATALKHLLDTANAQYPNDGLKLEAYSCYRASSDQYGPFCYIWRKNSEGKCAQPLIRAFKSAPPRYSEHATGYTLDLVIRWTTPAGLQKMRDLSWCAGGDTEPCPQIADTRVGQWLKDHAIEDGFEMSFPAKVDRGNGEYESAQGISFEPWHFRWVGTDGGLDAARDARHLFLRARVCFPADKPVVDPSTDPVTANDAGAIKCPKTNRHLGG